MGHPTQRGVCPDMACERIKQELEKAGGVKRVAYRVVAEEMGIPWTTARTWHSRETQVSPPLEPHSEQDVEDTVREMRPEKPRPKVYKLNRDEETERLERVVGEEFKAAFDAMLQAIQNAKALKWKTTSQEAAIHHIDVLYNVATIS